MSSLFNQHKKEFIIGTTIFSTLLICLFLAIHFFTSDFKIKKFNKIIEINYGENFKEEAGDVCYGNLFDCEEVEVIKNGIVDTNKLATYKISYTYKYKNKKKKLNQIVSVVDKEGPKLTIKTSSLKICPNGKNDTIEFVALDNIDGDISDKVKTELKDNILHVSVEDSSGNVTKEEVKVTLIDNISPKITLKGKSTINLKIGDNYEDEGADVSDNCDYNIVLKSDSNVDTSKAGTYKVIYEATDESGNKTTLERNVIVSKKASTNTTGGKYNIDKPTGDGIVYLTFDDGPSDYTPQLLDVLKKYNVKATFFVTGYGKDEYILREYNEGHTVALHSQTHDYSYIYKNLDNYFDDLYKVRDRVKEITGENPTLIRFPGGSSNTVSRRYDDGIHIMSILTTKVEEEGFHYFDWNVTSGDAGETTSTEVIYKNVTNGMRNHSVSIVLQHDTKKYSVDAVEKIIKFGLENGYTFEALDENSFGAHHGVNN